MTFAIAWKGLIFFLILSLLYPILKGGGRKRKYKRRGGASGFVLMSLIIKKKKDKAKKIKNVAKSAKIEVILGSVLLPIMNYVRSA